MRIVATVRKHFAANRIKQSEQILGCAFAGHNLGHRSLPYARQLNVAINPNILIASHVESNFLPKLVSEFSGRSTQAVAAVVPRLRPLFEAPEL